MYAYSVFILVVCVGACTVCVHVECVCVFVRVCTLVCMCVHV